MPSAQRSVLLRSAFVIVASLMLAVPAAGVAQTTRHVYVTVVGNDGSPVADLGPKDFRLREGGRDREVVSVEPATAPMRIALMVEELLTPAGGVRQGLFELAKALIGSAEISLIVVGQSNRTAVPFTTDLNAIVAGINELPLSQPPGTAHVPEGIGQMATEFQGERHERPVMVVVALDSLQASAMQPQHVLNQLRDSGAQLHVVSIDAPQRADDVAGAGGLMDTAGRAQVLGDGPRQSGGRQWPVTALTAVPRAMLSIANDLVNQYRITYVLPEGTKPSDRLDVRLNGRRDTTLRAPTRIRADR
jgi:hypothetical protein